jgi:chromosomal replication initiator protein
MELMDLERLWQSTLGEMEIQLSRASFATWLKNSRLIDKKDGVFYVAVASNFAKEWVEKKYQKNIVGILRNLDDSVKRIEFVVNNQELKEKSLPSVKSVIPVNDGALDLKTDPETGLNLKYGLSSFIVGPSNELAYAAASAIVNEIGKYNPFFIYGGVGLGKTHLLQGMGNEILLKYNKKIKPRYVSSEKFTSDIVWGIRNKRMEDIKRRYRDVDVLIIDDIQFIGGKEKTEEEFFHTFNALYENNKQIIISSDRPPQAIPTLEERLRSRFEGGLIADVSYPEYETRVAIIRSKLAETGQELSDPVIDLIAKRLKKNIRELEGIMKKILFVKESKHIEVTEKIAEDIIEKASINGTRKINDVQIIKAVAEFFNISTEDIMSHNRRKQIVEPRQITMYLLRDISELSYPYIGEKMGKDHTTAIHSYEKISQEINKNSSLNQKILMIKDIIYKS